MVSAMTASPDPNGFIEGAGAAAKPSSQDDGGNIINILLVDDEPKNLTVLETILDDPTYRLVRADSADQALLALVREEFALIILDIQMPGMTGFELAQMIKQRKKTAGVPIIFLTAYYSETEHILEGYGSGAVDYLHKPVNPVILRSKVAVFAALHRTTKQTELMNNALLAENTERRRVEEQLLKLNNELEDRVEKRTSELLSANLAMQESQRLLRLAQEAGQVGMWNWDLQTQMGTWTPTAWRLFGWEADCEDLPMLKWMSCLHPDDRSRAEDRINEAKKSGGYWDEIRILRKDKTHWIELTGAVEYEAGNPVRMRGVVRDITDRKEMELELKDAHRRKDEFLATLAHELRNPLAPIRNALQILKVSRGDSTTLQSITEMMDRQVRHLVRLVDDLLDVSRVMEGKIELRKERVDLLSVVTDAVETAQPQISDNQHTLEIRLPREPVYVQADPVRLTQIIGNLLTNAAKYTETGGRITLTAERNGSELFLRVLDTGIGVACDMLTRIFDLFVQVDNSSTRSQGGLGIGLTLVKNLVEMHGGEITATSAGLGQGSEFVVRLPMDCRAENESFEETRVAPPERQSHRLLVVDDNKDAADSLAMLLRMSGHNVQIAYEGRSAFEIAREFIPDVVFLDLGMPVIDGYEVARRLRAVPELQNTIVTAVTGWGQEEDRRRTAEAGFDHHLVKPIDSRAVETVLSSLKLGKD